MDEVGVGALAAADVEPRRKRHAQQQVENGERCGVVSKDRGLPQAEVRAGEERNKEDNEEKEAVAFVHFSRFVFEFSSGVQVAGKEL